MKKSQVIGHLAAAVTYVIFGLNIVFCRDIATESGLAPITLFAMRALVAVALFWLVSLLDYVRKRRRKRKGLLAETEPLYEKVPFPDLMKIFGAAVIGIFLPQVTFLNAIALTKPVDLSIITTITPILTMFSAAIFLREPITWKKAGGVLLSFVGIVWIILQSNAHKGAANQETTAMGITYTILNCTIFALYLGTCRKLVARYSVVTMMKWMFLVSLVLSLPFALPKMATSDFAAISTTVWLEIGFLILFATFVAYFLLPIGQARIRPTLVSMYGYLQPLIAIAVAIASGSDRLTLTKVVAALLVFAGVWIVTTSKAADFDVRTKK